MVVTEGGRGAEQRHAVGRPAAQRAGKRCKQRAVADEPPLALKEGGLIRDGSCSLGVARRW